MEVDKETVGSVLTGASISGIVAYFVHLFSRRSDRESEKVDEMESRIRQLELTHRELSQDIKHVREKQAEVDQKIDNLLEVMTLIRIQLNVAIKHQENS